MTMQKKTIRQGLVCWGLVMAVTGPTLGAISATSPPPIQVVLEDKDPHSPIGLYHDLQIRCLAKQHPDLPDAEIEAKVKPLPKGVAERYVTTRDERLFDGAKHAIYHAGQSMGIDLNDARCEPKLVRSYSAEVAVACELDARGTQLFPSVTPSGGLALNAPDFRAGVPKGKSLTCKRGEPPPHSKLKTAGLPVLRVGNLPCFSMTDAMLNVVGNPPRQDFLEGAGGDTCLWAEMPLYAEQEGRPVGVALADRHTPEEVALRAAQGREHGTPQYAMLLPVEFQVGKPIPASRFTAEAAKAFVSQSAILTVDVDHAAMK